MSVLLNPGPVVLTDRVRQALLKPDLCHREPEFITLQDNIRTKLLDVYALEANDWAAVLMTGSGTSAMEAMMSSCIPAHGKVLIIENGVYGERLGKIAEIHEINHLKLHFEWGEEISLQRLEDELQYHDEISHVAVVHHETTTGRLNDIDAISRLCKKYQVTILLDAVSSFAAEEIKFDDWNIAAAAATANKCIHATPGASFVILNRQAFQQTKATKPASLYLNLRSYLDSQDNGGTPFTQSIQSFYTLDEALSELKDEGGWQTRNQIYWQRINKVRDGLDALGIKAMLPKENCSSVLNAFFIPENMTYQDMHDALKKDGFVIYAGQGQFEKNIFRISCMGDIQNDDLEKLLASFQRLLSD